MKRLNDIFPEWLTGSGIFGLLQALEVPWRDDNVSTELDIIYHGSRSGEKLISPLLDKLCVDGELTTENAEELAKAIAAVNLTNWVKVWDTLSFEYNPIENYSMIEELADDETVDEYGRTNTRTNNLSHTKTGTEQDAPNTTETQTPNLSNETDNSIYAFNSSDPVPTGEQTQTSTGTNTMTRTGTDTRTYNTIDADTGTQSDVAGGRDTHTRNYTLTRSGNIGVTTSQQMLESERNLWKWNYFNDVIFPDLDKLLTLKIY